MHGRNQGHEQVGTVVDNSSRSWGTVLPSLVGMSRRVRPRPDIVAKLTEAIRAGPIHTRRCPDVFEVFLVKVEKILSRPF